MTNRADIFERVTADVLTAMERDGLAPWAKPWTFSGDMPHNAVSGKPYRGGNVLLLMLAGWAKGYSDPRWLTFKQAKDMGGSVRKGEKATKIIFWKPIKKTDKATGEEKKSVIMREYAVFNAEQCDGIPAFAARLPTKPDQRNAAADALIASSFVTIHHGGDKAYYSPMVDAVTLPKRETFKTESDYYCTAFHEMGHATGHPSRLDREGITKFDGFGSHQYSREELVAEFSACFVAAALGVERTTVDNSAAYIKTWAAKLRDDPKLLISAAQAAQKAADFVLDSSAVEEDEDEAEAA